MHTQYYSGVLYFPLPRVPPACQNASASTRFDLGSRSAAPAPRCRVGAALARVLDRAIARPGGTRDHSLAFPDGAPLHRRRIMFRLLIAALCLSAASAYNGAAPVGKTTVFTGSKNSNIYRTAAPSPLAAPAQVRSPVVYMSGAEEVVQYEQFDPIKLAVWIVPWLIILVKTNGIGPAM